MKVETNIETDIAIVGAGVAGCIAAIALSPLHRVVLIDQLAVPIERIGECLPPAARRILQRLHLLAGMETASVGSSLQEPSISAPHLQSLGMRSYWGSEQVQVVDHLRNPDGFGWHLDRQAFDSFLRESAVQRGATGIWPAKLHSSDFQDLRWNLVATSGSETTSPTTYHVSTRFVIDASGRRSHFAKQQGIPRQQLDKLVACWATLPDLGANKMGLIAATDQGWWYSAPLPHNNRVLAFQTDSDLIESGIHKTPSLFIRQAQSHPAIAKYLAKAHNALTLHGIVAASSNRLTQVAGPQWVALGDAATAFDPLSSQGMFNAMAAAMQLTELLQASGLMQNFNSEVIQKIQALYTRQVEQIWQYYVKHKNLFYRQERRWPHSEFWKRRHG